MYDRVLVPTGVAASDAGERTVRRALDVAQRYDADLHVLRIADPRTADAETPATNPNGARSARDGGRSAVPDRVEERAVAAGVTVVEADRCGPPADVIATYGDEEDDVVVMPERGPFCGEPYRLGGGVGRSLRETPLSVMTVRTEK